MTSIVPYRKSKIFVSTENLLCPKLTGQVNALLKERRWGFCRSGCGREGGRGEDG